MNAEWLDRGERWRADRPAAARSAAVTHGRGVQVVDGGGPGAQAFESSSGVAIFARRMEGRVARLDRGVVMGP